MQHGHPRMRCTKCGRSVLARLAGASNHMLKGVGTRQECCASRGNSCCCYCSRAWDKGGRVVAPVFGREPVRAAAVVVASRAAKSVAICTSCCAWLFSPVEAAGTSSRCAPPARSRRVRRHARYRHVRADIQARRWRPTLTSRLDASLMGASSSTRAAVRHVVDTKIRDLPMRKRRLMNGHARKWVRANALRAAMVARHNAAVVKLRSAVAALHCANRASEGKRQYGQRIRNGTGHITCVGKGVMLSRLKEFNLHIVLSPLSTNTPSAAFPQINTSHK